LAIIAYKQPLTRSEIESLRNVNVDGVMKSLMDKDLIRICGRKKVPGRPFVYGTTRQFLEHFGLNSLDELPKMDEFSAMAKEVEDKVDIEPISETESAELNPEVTQSGMLKQDGGSVQGGINLEAKNESEQNAQ